MSQYPNGPQQPYQQPPQGGYPPNQGYPPQGAYPGQPPFTTQPGYPPPGYPQMPQQPEPKKKKSKKGIIALGIVVGAVVLCAIIASTSHSGSAPTSSSTTSSSTTSNTTQQPPSQPQTWTTTHIYTGSGTKKTETIAVPDDWKIQWKCDPASFGGMSYNMIITVYNSDGNPADVAINDLCKPGNTSGETEERHAGNIYFDVNSEGSWTITTQELK